MSRIQSPAKDPQDPLAHQSHQVRRLHQADAHLVESFYLALSQDERVKRFHANMSDDILRRHAAQLKFEPGLCLGVFIEDRLAGVAELHMSPGADLSEFAIVLSDEVRGLGVGSSMMASIKSWAKAHGIEKIEAHISAYNEPMKILARRGGFFLRRHPDGVLASITFDHAHPEMRAHGSKANQPSFA